MRGRYSIIGLAPDIVWRASGNSPPRSTVVRPGDRMAFKALKKPTLDALRALLDESRIDVPEGLPPMAAGVFGYMGYDTGQARRAPALTNAPTRSAFPMPC